MVMPSFPLSVSEAVQLFKALGDARRLRLLLLLAEHGPMHVAALCAAVGQSQTAVSNQLRVLRMTGLVRSRRQGHLAIYSLASEHARHFLRFVQAGRQPRGH